ncbi:MAG TPA: glycogen-binding domain-containing protein [Longimicrobiales bacterium]
MDNRTHRALDGELERGQLTAGELAELAAAEAEIGAIRDAIPLEPLPDLAAAVMRRIEAAHPRPAAAPRRVSTLTAAIDWIWKPRPISIGWRPAYGFAGALVLALIVWVGRPAAPEPHATPMVFTQFLLNAPDAHQVSLAGDFTNWQPAYVLTRAEPGVWTVVVPLEPGIHNYAFVVNGERWIPDPNAPAFDDGFGGLNSRLAVIAPDDEEL